VSDEKTKAPVARLEVRVEIRDNALGEVFQRTHLVAAEVLRSGKRMGIDRLVTDIGEDIVYRWKERVAKRIEELEVETPDD